MNNRSIELGFPSLTASFLRGQDIFYKQFNEISFFIEDTGQERFYYNILKKLFPNLKVEKIFPLDGKKNVIDDARLNILDKTKVYIVDLDFDEILERTQSIVNLFYLDKYSIENYLCSKENIYEVIREKNPRLSNRDIEKKFNLHKCQMEWKKLLSELSSSFIVIQMHSLGKEYYGINPARDFDLNTSPVCYKNNFIINYFIELEVYLKTKNRRYSLNAQIKKYKKHYKTKELAIKNIPGKYILNLLKYQLDKKKLINSCNLESFAYRLSKDADVDELHFLKNQISNYIR